MDRFIVFISKQDINCFNYLKSNMDRFIGGFLTEAPATLSHLKSNMDRFIEIVRIQKKLKTLI